MNMALRRMLEAVLDLLDVLRSSGVPVQQNWAVGESSFARLLCPEAELVQGSWVATAAATMSGRREPRGRMSVVEMMLAAIRVRDRDELLLAAGYFMPGLPNA